MSFRVGGLVSGIDVDSIVEQLAAAERRPIKILENKEAVYNVQLSAFGNLKGALDSLNSAVKDLNTAYDFKTFTAHSGNESLITASASASAAAGSYNVTVQQLAQAQKMTSGAFAKDELLGAGTLTIKVGDAAAVDIAVSADATLSDVAKSINEADAGLKAGVIYDGTSYFLTLTGENTGETNTISLTVNDGDADPDAGLSRLVEGSGSQKLAETQAAQDAIITVDGVQDIKRGTNTIDDVISGVTLNLEAAPEAPGNATTLKIDRDLSAITSKVDEFVSAFNKVVDFFKSSQKYDKATKTTGELFGDTTTNMIRGNIRSLMRSSVTGIEGFRRLSDLGLTHDADGYLKVDSSKLKEALTNNFDDVVKFFTNTEEGAEGFAVRANKVLDAMTSPRDGIITTRKSGIQSRIDNIHKDIEQIEKRIKISEMRTRAQFVSLELLMGQYQATSDYLAQQLEGLANLNKAK